MRIEDIEDLDPEFVLIAGDWHGNAPYAKKVIQQASESGIEVIVHVGDFGWNFGNRGGEFFDKPLRLHLEKYNMVIIWIDGNHDNHEELRNLPVREDGFVQTGKGGRLYWAPRAHRWTWRNKVFAAMGGAFSINFDYLTEGIDLFAGIEEVQKEDVVKLGTDRVDILLTHEVPMCVPVKKHIHLPESIEKNAEKSRILLQEAVQNVLPELVFSGHWHQRLEHNEHIDGHDVIFNVLDREYAVGNHVLVEITEYLPEIDVFDVGQDFKYAKFLIKGINPYDEEA